PIRCTEATRDLAALLLPDSGHLQEKDAEFANRHGFSKHKPALPLYTEADAERALRQFRPLPFRKSVSVPGQMNARFLYTGHILGASMIELTKGAETILFTGDLGRPNDIALYDPDIVEHADYLVVESTYGDRKHSNRSPEDALAEAVGQTAAHGGTVLIPA